MEAKLSFLSPKPVSPNAGEALPAATGAEAKAPATEFSEVLTGQMFKTQRQGIAASNSASAGLQVVPLGKSINVITSDAPLPDMASLASFARAQGLDEAAVQALFGPLPSTKDAVLSPAAVPTGLPSFGPTLVLATAPSLATALSAKALGVADYPAPSTPPAQATALVAASAIQNTASDTIALTTESESTAENDRLLPDTTTAADALTQASALATSASSGAAMAASGHSAEAMAASGHSAVAMAASGHSAVAMAASGHSALAMAASGQSAVAMAAPGHSAVAVATSGHSAEAMAASGGAIQKGPVAGAALAQSQASALNLSPLGSKEDNQTALLPQNTALGHAQPLDRVAVTALEITAASSAPLMPLSARAWIDAAPTAKISDTMAQAQAGTGSAVRLTLGMPAQEITKRLAQMSGTSKQVSWSALLESAAVSKDALDAPIAQEILQLDVPEGYQLEANDLTAQTEPGLQAPASAAANNTGAAVTLAPGEKPSLQAQLEQRAAQFQQMADKLGEAAAQRLIAQIERGQWKMQMRMQPGSLGRIDVQLEMHSGGLDALFSSDNAVTRELIAQGTNKLKDTLAQSGMAVASVWVNADQGRQSGGNSTPGQAYKGPQNAPNSPAPAQAVATAPDQLGSKGSDGLNILA